MILKLNPLPKIPYIDGVPDDSTQTSIAWVLHGELLEGAKTKTSNEGSLNRTSVEIQQNAVRLETNIKIQTTKINEVIEQTHRFRIRFQISRNTKQPEIRFKVFRWTSK